MGTKLDSRGPEIIEAYRNNVNIRSIADAHACSTGTVRTFLIRAGVQLRQRGRPRKVQTNG